MSRQQTRQQIDILGVRIDCVDFAQTLALIEEWITTARAQAGARGECRQICTVNPEFVIDANANPGFAAVLRRADLCVPDGVGLLLAAKLQGVQLHERVTGSDGIYRICERAAAQGWKVYFLGAAPGVAKITAQRLQLRYPALQVVGAASGNPTADEWPGLRASIQAAQPDILFVAFGHPKQDFWIDSHRGELSSMVAIGVGGAFDFVAGVQQRAPAIWQRLGLEWLYRLLREPKRWRRMLKLPQFVVKVLFSTTKATV